MLGKEKKRSRIMAVQMDNLRSLLSIGRMDKFLNTRIREFCRVTKGLMKALFGGLAMWRK